MDEVLRRRLIGAAVLLAAAFGLAALLPGPDSGGPPRAGHVVTYDLRTGQPIDGPAAAAAAPVAQATAPPAPAPEPPVAKPASPDAGQPAQVPAPLPHPTLKVDESLGEPAAGGWFVQIGSFESQANARAVLQKLYGASLPAVIQTVPVGRKLWYRVRVGPYSAEGPAQKALEVIGKKGYASAKLVRPDAGPSTGRN